MNKPTPEYKEFLEFQKWKEDQKKSKKPEPKESGNGGWVALILAAWFIYALLTAT